MGWVLQPTLEAKGPVGVFLKMALQTRKKKNELVHHSERGVQYCSWTYGDLIQKVGIKMSICFLQNPIKIQWLKALKEEFNLGNGFVSEEAALKSIPKVIETHDNYRPHASLDFKTPTKCHHSGQVKKLKCYHHKNIMFF